MKYPASHLTPFPPTFPRIRRRTHSSSSMPPWRIRFVRPLFSWSYKSLFPQPLFLSHPYKTPAGVTRERSPIHPTSVLSVPQWQIQSLISSARPPDLHNFSALIATFRINTCISVASKRLYPPLVSTLNELQIPLFSFRA